MQMRKLGRIFYYFRIGYNHYLRFPISILGYISAIYYLALRNIGFFQKLFPHFNTFIIAVLIILPPSAVILGLVHVKHFMSGEQEANVEANPYATERVPPIQVPLWKLIREIARRHGIDTSELDKILQKAGETAKS